MNTFNLTPSRRSFLKSSASAVALSMLGPYALDITLRSKPWRVALIGTGWYGKSDLMRLIQVANIEVVGLCDVDKNQLQGAAELVKERMGLSKKPPCFSDYKKMLRSQTPEIVLIGSPDHWHALQAIDSIKAGAHVYLQKPISLDVLEGEAILSNARKYNRVVQIGTQRRSTPHLVAAKERIIDSGLLGNISHVEMCCYYHMRMNKPHQLGEIPKELDYNQWVGPATYLPYEMSPHRGWWRGKREYCNGIMGDMCVHMYDAVRWMLDLGWPIEVSSTGGIYVQKDSTATTADTQHAIFKHEKLNCVWQHRSWGTAPDPDYPWGFFIYGDKGTLKGSVHKFEFESRDKSTKISDTALFEKEKYPEDINEKSIELHVASATRRHFIDFLGAIENKSLPVADIKQGHISTASCILANMSMDLEMPLQYDPSKQTIINNLQANMHLKRNYREGWEHPWV
ncbi:MAG: putative dehydrogenase [Saprospiraceae bacterium]|jgi:predicted dehydrogenase